MPKKKNSIRCAPTPFESTLTFVSYRGDDRKSGEAFGHLLHDDGAVSTILPEIRSTAVKISNSDRNVIFKHIPDIPLGAYMRVTATRPDREAYPEFDFFVFESHVPHIFIRLLNVREPVPAPPPHTAICATIATISEVCIKDTESGALMRPWDEFFIGSSGEEQVWRIDVESTELIPATACRFLKLGYVVACSGVPATFLRIKGMQLKWTTDETCATTMSTINDTMPGLSPTLWPDVYTSDFQIQRPMLFWGMFAGCQLSRHQQYTEKKREGRGEESEHPVIESLVDLSEPLQSYINVLCAVKEHRKVTGSIDSFAAAEVSEALKYNTCSRLTEPQQAQALAIFYWASVHVGLDAEIGGKEKTHYRHALNLYLIMFGYVLLRKRAYEFHVTEKRKRAAAHRIAAYATLT